MMKYLQNLHTHSTYDDGKDTLEEMIGVAIDKGFSSIGFSGHSYMHYAPGASMSLKGTEEYKKEITALKEKYNGKIDIFCGLEFDIFSEIDMSGYDYMIGSVHFLRIGDKYVAFDRRETGLVQDMIDKWFNGNGMAFAKEYYKTVASLPKYGNFDIIGHFDVITKHNDRGHFFDENSKEYLTLAIEAIETLSGKIPYFEVNTGAIGRNYKIKPYPAEALLCEFKRLGFGAVISSDCHNGEFLDCHFKESKELLRKCGFKEIFILTKTGFKPEKI